MLKHMHRGMTWKNAKHGIPYGYLLNHVFEHFGVPLGRGVVGTIKQTFSTATLLEFSSGKDVEIARLRTQLQQAISQGPGTSSDSKEEVKKLRVENAWLIESNASLNEEIKSLNKQLIQAHVDANSRMNLVLQSFSPRPSLS
ncbi:hypothetical protein KY290_005015 [Solanum tuberosum]|uniref:Uncharacterized protein n=1 Tax=Solanum tuberosum TaxID=4113 RepID=A0ABQ7WEQ2_SOLTU|nr:hypothetical protein KY289_006865 [Solanum tuberosum]KAH0778588.1 hypothetical protein KY290_005015 [Solanum tuberosum]